MANSYVFTFFFLTFVSLFFLHIHALPSTGPLHRKSQPLVLKDQLPQPTPLKQDPLNNQFDVDPQKRKFSEEMGNIIRQLPNNPMKDAEDRKIEKEMSGNRQKSEEVGEENEMFKDDDVRDRSYDNEQDEQEGGDQDEEEKEKEEEEEEEEDYKEEYQNDLETVEDEKNAELDQEPVFGENLIDDQIRVMPIMNEKEEMLALEKEFQSEKKYTADDTYGLNEKDKEGEEGEEEVLEEEDLENLENGYDEREGDGIDGVDYDEGMGAEIDDEIEGVDEDEEEEEEEEIRKENGERKLTLEAEKSVGREKYTVLLRSVVYGVSVGVVVLTVVLVFILLFPNNRLVLASLLKTGQKSKHSL